MKKKSHEYENFDATMRQLMKVSHAELKAALDAEKAAKKIQPPKRTTNAKKRKDI